ncbi:hypothetical protein Rhe02_81400 [Rhizocola hellebori]|uniref:Uncharacterized protein n=1 Tax=Rhizocola hellebori TaxID=1392758 RepID=A0A8J3QIL0_9ACTN|nr:hypothetical protein Rhe02_81400 [Rhizocola hellebori]
MKAEDGLGRREALKIKPMRHHECLCRSLDSIRTVGHSRYDPIDKKHRIGEVPEQRRTARVDAGLLARHPQSFGDVGQSVVAEAHLVIWVGCGVHMDDNAIAVSRS